LKELTHYFNEKNILFKTIEEIEAKQLESRKKIKIFCATGIDKNYYAIFILNAQSRFLKKNAEELIVLCGKLAQFKGHNFKKKILLIGSPLCSKAKEFLKQNEWSVKNDFM
jgi:myosin-crossreactive antigen